MEIMKKAFRNIFGLLILGIGLSLGVSNASAEEHVTLDLSQVEAIFDESLDAYVVPLKTETETSPSEINVIKEVEPPMNDSQLIDIAPLRDYYEYYKFVRTAHSVVDGPVQKVTANISCTTPKCSVRESVSATVSASYSVGLTAEKNAIKANAGFTWTNSATRSTTFSFEGLKTGEKGYVAFKPYLNRVWGKLSRYSNWDGLLDTKNASADAPKLLSNGAADGEFYFVYTVKK